MCFILCIVYIFVDPGHWFLFFSLYGQCYCFRQDFLFLIEFLGATLVNNINFGCTILKCNTCALHRVFATQSLVSFWPPLPFCSTPPSLFSGDHHTIVCIYEFVCSILFYVPCANEIIWLLSFSLWFISVNMRLSRSTHVVEMAIFNIPLYIRTTSSLSNHRSQDTWVVFMSSPQWIMLQWR